MIFLSLRVLCVLGANSIASIRGNEPGIGHKMLNA